MTVWVCFGNKYTALQIKKGVTQLRAEIRKLGLKYFSCPVNCIAGRIMKISQNIALVTSKIAIYFFHFQTLHLTLILELPLSIFALRENINWSYNTRKG